MSDLGYIQSSPKKEYTGIKTIRSLSIKQLHGSETEDGSSVTYVDGKELSSFRIIGWVTKVRTTNTGKSFILEDGTREIECMMWVNKAFEEYCASLVEEGILVKITGTLKEYAGKKSVTVANLYVVEDYNEFLYHMTSIAKEHIAKKEIPSAKPTGDMKKIQKDILECIRNNQDEDTGLDYKIIIKCLQNEYQEKMIKENLEDLVDNCHLVMIDEDGYKTVN